MEAVNGISEISIQSLLIFYFEFAECELCHNSFYCTVSVEKLDVFIFLNNNVVFNMHCTDFLFIPPILNVLDDVIFVECLVSYHSVLTPVLGLLIYLYLVS